MTAIHGIRAARLIGCLLGVALAAALFVASRPASGGYAVGADVSFHANLTGELLVSPAGPEPFLRDRALHPGQRESGSMTLTNQTGDPLRVRLRALPSTPILNDLLEVELRDDRRLLVSGPLGTLATASGAPLTLAPGANAAITATVSLSSRADTDLVASALVEVAILFERHDARAEGGKG